MKFATIKLSGIVVFAIGNKAIRIEKFMNPTNKSLQTKKIHKLK